MIFPDLLMPSAIDSPFCRVFLRAASEPCRASKPLLAGKISGMLTTLTHSSEKDTGQQYQTHTLNSIDLSEPEEIWHQPIPEHLYNKAQNQRKHDDNTGPPYNVADNMRPSSLSLVLMVVCIKHRSPYPSELFSREKQSLFLFLSEARPATTSCYGKGLSAYKESGILYLSV